MTLNHSIYLHIPFCRHRCAYCDFNTYAGQEGSIPAYVDALCRELRLVAGSAPRALPIHTVFFGGGTPSLLEPAQFASILAAISNHFELGREAEITIEANPGTVTAGDLRRLRALGVNRISFGVQSANPEELRQLEREHDFFDVIRAVAWARQAGFENLNLDLIYGLPEQALETWKTSVRRILDLAPEHISAYALTLEHGTPFGRWSQRGLMPLPDPDLAADMYEWAGREIEAAGYSQYEISNWARPDRECRHNLQYWRGLPYLGFGAGAHGYANGCRYSNVLRIKTYIDRCLDSASAGPAFPLSAAAVNRHQQTRLDDFSEFMITGLRLTREGISAADFSRRFGRELQEVYGRQIEELTGLGLLERVGTPAAQVLRLTRRGRLLGNQVFLRFVE